MSRISARIPWAAWFGDGSLELDFPERWEVSVCSMLDAPEMSAAQIRTSCCRPASGSPLGQIAAAHKTAAIVVDDLSRPTPAHAVVPYLVEELSAAGIARENVIFVISLGSHAPLSSEDMARKLGAETVARHQVWNHDCEGDLVDLGVTVGSVPVRINRHVMAADLKILVGSVVPHNSAAFSGGPKMVLPGLSNIESIEWAHKSVMMGFGGAGAQAGSRFRAQSARIARSVGIDFSVQVVVNSRRNIAGVFAGELEATHRQAMEFASRVYATQAARGMDVVVLNAYPKDGELLQADNAFIYHRSAPPDYVTDDGLILVTSACSRGLGQHGLFGPGQRLYREPKPVALLGSRQMAAFMPSVSRETFHKVYWDGYPHFESWPSARAFLERRYPGGARVGVYPCASIQMSGEGGTEAAGR